MIGARIAAPLPAERTPLVAGDHRPHARIVSAVLGNDAGMIGAADLARSITR